MSQRRKWSTFVQNPKFLEATRQFLIPEELKPIVISHCGIKPHMRVLDVGCGTGYLSRMIASYVEDVEVIGIDNDEEFIKYAQQIAKDSHLDHNIHFMVGNGLALPFSDQAFDAVVSHTFLSSVSDPGKALEEMKRVCRMKGMISSITPMGLEPQAMNSGHYPDEYLWYDRLQYLEAKVWMIYEALTPIEDYRNSLKLSDMPHFFHTHGLQKVSMFPIGKAFSLSDAAISNKDKIAYINTLSEAKEEKILAYAKLPQFQFYMSAEEVTSYIDLLHQEKQCLINNVQENRIWQWEGGANILVSGVVEKEGKKIMEINASYDKHKDETPAATLQKIHRILNELDIQTEVTWTQRCVQECYSNRVVIKGTLLGSNGKGTSALFCETSGYAELMERLQNRALYSGQYDPGFIKKMGMYWSSDEQLMKMEEIAQMDNAFFRAFYERMGCKGYFEQLKALYQWGLSIDEQNHAIMIPYYSLQMNDATYIPLGLCFSIYGSNGMCAGNTMEEALVQGLAEVYERHVGYVLIHDHITPPDVPREVIKQYPELYRMIEEIERTGQYRVMVKDCSLQKGYPVIGTIIINKETGTFGFKLAAHPSFAVALERTLTEAFQGKNLEEFTHYNRIGSDEQVSHRDNYLNTMKTGHGYHRKELFAEEASYPCQLTWNMDAASNSEMLKFMLDLLINQGYDVLIRDVSFLGFPSYSIIIPGFSEFMSVDELRGKELITQSMIRNSITHLSQANTEEIQRLLRFLKFKSQSLLENDLTNVLGLPFDRPLPGGYQATNFLMMACHYRLGDYNKAYSMMSTIISDKVLENQYYRCIESFLEFKSNGMTLKEIHECLEKLYDEHIAHNVIEQFGEEDDVIRKLYPKFQCWNCDHCEASKICCYPAVEALHEKILQKEKTAHISQKEFGHKFGVIYHVNNRS